MTTASPVKNVVLVHGGLWTGPAGRASTTCSSRTATPSALCRTRPCPLEGDVAATREIIGAQDGPVVLVGHSYGGAVITEAGTDPNVAALVYIAAFAPRHRRIGKHAHCRPAARRARAALRCRPETASCSWTGRSSRLVRRRRARRAGGLHGRLTSPVGRRRPGRTDHRPCMAHQAELVHDHNPRPDDPPARAARHVRASRLTVVEVAASHSVYLSQPGPVADLIEQASSAMTMR